MYPQTLARPYANAAFALAGTNAEAWLKFLQGGASLIRTSLNTFLLDPRILAKDKAETFIALFDKNGGSWGETKLTQTFVHELARANRLTLLPFIAEIFSEKLAIRKGEFPVVIQSAFPISAGVLSELTESLQKIFAVKLKPQASVDAGLLGGFRARVGNRVLDCSLQTLLEKAGTALSQ